MGWVGVQAYHVIILNTRTPNSSQASPCLHTRRTSGGRMRFVPQLLAVTLTFFNQGQGANYPHHILIGMSSQFLKRSAWPGLLQWQMANFRWVTWKPQSPVLSTWTNQLWPTKYYTTSMLPDTVKLEHIKFWHFSINFGDSKSTASRQK